MKKFYATFGQNHTTPEGLRLKDYWVEILADSEDSAHNKMYDEYGSNWSMLYSEDDFDPEWYPNGKLKEI